MGYIKEQLFCIILIYYLTQKEIIRFNKSLQAADINIWKRPKPEPYNGKGGNSHRKGPQLQSLPGVQRDRCEKQTRIMLSRWLYGYDVRLTEDGLRSKVVKRNFYQV